MQLKAKFSQAVATLTVAAVAAAALSACSRFDPKADAKPGLTQTVNIVAKTDSTEHLVLAELYKQTLASEGRAANVIELAASNPTAVPSAGDHQLDYELNGNLYIGCTGSLLNDFDPNKAEELSQEYVKDREDPSGQDFLATTHIALMNSLPPIAAVVEPASAEGCEGATPKLPENYVALYQKGLFNREEKLAVASLTKFLTREEIDKLVTKANQTSIREAVAEWMAESNARTVMDTGGDKNSSSSDLSGDSNTGSNKESH